ncbi:carboxypeptidase regulatory-like domain-containing protein [Actinoplanes sp. NPDC026670]|uniref:carboxypeptidase regulatory-like domain-containing protein n=1 Tax=Actinoplanes sp. NPDC026670 TaxID=3154700 RepID=UPI0033FD998F
MHPNAPSRLRRFTAVAVAAILTTTPMAAPARAEPTGATYYVDAVAGDDTDTGLTSANAWRTLDQVNRTAFQPGDRILLRAGQRWTGQLWPKGDGTGEAPIVVDRWGDGDKPGIDAGGTTDDAVRLFNQEHWTIRNLDVTNAAPSTGTPGENLADLRGIHISGDNGRTLDGFLIDAVDVHDVTGEVRWISGAYEQTEPGIYKGNGWDRSKRTGGVVLDTTVADITAPGATPTVLNDVTVQNSTIVNTSFAGIVVKQYSGDAPGAAATGWGSRDNATDPKFVPHTGVVLRGNYIRQDGTPYGCNGIYLTGVRGALVERNVVHRTGTSGIETYFADDVTVQFNEVYETTVKAGGADSNGIDADKGTTRQVLQYNFVHHNGDGFLICQFSFGDVVIRGNVVASNSRHQVYLHSDRAARAEVYHNTIYSDRSATLVYGYGSSLNATYTLRNNVLFSTRAGAALTTSPTIRYESNLYGGAELAVPDSDTRPVIGAPIFVNPQVTGPFGTPATGPQLATAHGFAVTSASPAIDGGVVIEANGGLDYAGAALYNGDPDIGAFEYRTPAGASAETVAGYVRTPAGLPVADAAVTAAGRSATTSAGGWFAIPDVPFGPVTLTASRNGYESVEQTVSVTDQNRATVRVELASTSTVGVITGRVLDQYAQPVAEAEVTVRDGSQTIAGGTSGADGVFSVGGVPVGEGFTVTASAPALVPASRAGLTVGPDATTDAGALLLAADVPDHVDVQDFAGLPDGPLATGTNGLTVSGTVEVTGGAARLTRTVNSGTTRVLRTFDPPLKGLVTVESRVMIDQPYVSGNHWWGVPYVTGSDGVNAISVAFTKNTVVAYNGASTVTVGRYELGRWHRLRCVIDTVNQRFDLYLDGVQVLSRATFRVPVDGVARLDWFANSSNYGVVHLDDLRVSQGVGLTPDDTALRHLSTGHGLPQPVTGSGYLLEVAATVGSVDVTAVARSRFARSVAIGDSTTDGDRAVATVTLGDTGSTVPVTVTAEDGTRTAYSLEIRKPSLAADASLSALTASVADLDPAFTPDLLDYAVEVPSRTTKLQVTAVPANPRSAVSVGGNPSPATIRVPFGTTAVPIVVTSADGTATSTYTITVTRPRCRLPLP